MQTRRDQLQAYWFVTARAQSALLHGEPDAAERPMRRIGLSTFAGLMIAVVVVVGFGIFGLLRPGGKEGWKQHGVLVVERETGTRFYYDSKDDALHPVLNYTSARLLLDSPSPEVQYFSHRSLSAARRGPTYGLPNLPDSLPDANGLVTSPWMVCSKPPTGTNLPVVTVSVGMGAAGRHIDVDKALLVATAKYGNYLIWNDTRLAIRAPGQVLPALGFNSAAAVRVADTWVNSVPPGPDLRAPQVPGRGEPGPSVGGQSLSVGQVLRVPAQGSSQDQYWLVLKDGITSINATDAFLLIGDPAEQQQAYHGQNPELINVSSVAVVQAPKVAPAATSGFPPQVPSLLDPSQGGPQVPCAAYTANPAGSPTVQVSLADEAPGARDQATVAFGLGTQASQVVLPPGAAAVAQMALLNGQPSGAFYLVTDAGGKYPVPTSDVLKKLGYGSAQPVMVPKGILDLIPTGPALDPDQVWKAAPIAPNSVSLPINPTGGGS